MGAARELSGRPGLVPEPTGVGAWVSWAELQARVGPWNSCVGLGWGGRGRCVPGACRASSAPWRGAGPARPASPDQHHPTLFQGPASSPAPPLELRCMRSWKGASRDLGAAAILISQMFDVGGAAAGPGSPAPMWAGRGAWRGTFGSKVGEAPAGLGWAEAAVDVLAAPLCVLGSGPQALTSGPSVGWGLPGSQVSPLTQGPLLTSGARMPISRTLAVRTPPSLGASPRRLQ